MERICVLMVAPFFSFFLWLLLFVRLSCLKNGPRSLIMTGSSFFPFSSSRFSLTQRGRRHSLGIDMWITLLSMGPLSLIKCGSHTARASASYHHVNAEGLHQSVWVTTQWANAAILYLQSVSQSVSKAPVISLSPSKPKGVAFVLIPHALLSLLPTPMQTCTQKRRTTSSRSLRPPQPQPQQAKAKEVEEEAAA